MSVESVLQAASQFSATATQKAVFTATRTGDILARAALNFSTMYQSRILATAAACLTYEVPPAQTADVFCWKAFLDAMNLVMVLSIEQPEQSAPAAAHVFETVFEAIFGAIEGVFGERLSREDIPEINLAYGLLCETEQTVGTFRRIVQTFISHADQQLCYAIARMTAVATVEAIVAFVREFGEEVVDQINESIPEIPIGFATLAQAHEDAQETYKAIVDQVVQGIQAENAQAAAQAAFREAYDRVFAKEAAKQVAERGFVYNQTAAATEAGLAGQQAYARIEQLAAQAGEQVVPSNPRVIVQNLPEMMVAQEEIDYATLFENRNIAELFFSKATLGEMARDEPQESRFGFTGSIGSENSFIWFAAKIRWCPQEDPREFVAKTARSEALAAGPLFGDSEEEVFEGMTLGARSLVEGLQGLNWKRISVIAPIWPF